MGGRGLLFWARRRRRRARKPARSLRVSGRRANFASSTHVLAAAVGASVPGSMESWTGLEAVQNQQAAPRLIRRPGTVGCQVCSEDGGKSAKSERITNQWSLNDCVKMKQIYTYIIYAATKQIKLKLY